VIVCHCEAVDDRTVRSAILAGASDIGAVGERCRAGSDCGGCHRAIERLLSHMAGDRDVAAVA